MGINLLYCCAYDSLYLYNVMSTNNALMWAGASSTKYTTLAVLIRKKITQLRWYDGHSVGTRLADQAVFVAVYLSSQRCLKYQTQWTTMMQK